MQILFYLSPDKQWLVGAIHPDTDPLGTVRAFSLKKGNCRLCQSLVLAVFIE